MKSPKFWPDTEKHILIRFQEATFYRDKKNCGRGQGIKSLPGSSFASTVKIVLFSDQGPVSRKSR